MPACLRKSPSSMSRRPQSFCCILSMPLLLWKSPHHAPPIITNGAAPANPIPQRDQVCSRPAVGLSVRGHRQRARGGRRRPDASRRNARPGLAATHDGEVRAECGERFCGRQPNAIGGTRDQDLLVVHGTAIQGYGHARMSGTLELTGAPKARIVGFPTRRATDGPGLSPNLDLR
jgi:hypothetical protein